MTADKPPLEVLEDILAKQPLGPCHPDLFEYRQKWEAKWRNIAGPVTANPRKPANEDPKALDALIKSFERDWKQNAK